MFIVFFIYKKNSKKVQDSIKVSAAVNVHHIDKSKGQLVLDEKNKSQDIDSIFNSDVFRSNDVFKLVYNNLINIINNNPINKEIQMKIERYLLNQFKDIYENKSKVLLHDVDFSMFNKGFK